MCYLPRWEESFQMYTYHFITIYTLNILKFCQLYFNKDKQNKTNLDYLKNKELEIIVIPR